MSKQLKTKIPVAGVLKRKEIFKPAKVKIKIIGIGGGGGSIVSEMAEELKGFNFLVADTDQRSFQGLPARVKIFEFGQELTKGWGTGMNPEIGEKAALQAKEKIKKIIQNTDLIILISCLGGGIGSGALPVFARILNDEKKLCLGIFALPFNFEGEKKAQMAQDALKNLKENLSGMIVLSNEEILKQSEKKIPLKKSLALMNCVLIDYLRDLMEVIFQTGIINIDFADLRTILGGRSQKVFLGRALGQGLNKTEEALKELFENPFFAFSEQKQPSIKKILLNISGGSDLTLKEVEKIGERISELNFNAKIIFGFSRFPKYDKKLKITFLGTSENFFEKEKAIEFEKQEVKKEMNKKINKEIEQEVQIKQKNAGKEEKKIEKKIKIRRSALEVKKTKQEAKEEEWEKELDWETPSFLRKKIKDE